MARFGKINMLFTVGFSCLSMATNAQSNSTVIMPAGKGGTAPARAMETASPAKTMDPSAPRAMSRSLDKAAMIQGTVSGDTKGNNQIYYYADASSMDSVAIVNGQFKIFIPFDSPFKILLYTQYERVTSGRYAPFALLVDQPGIVNINMDIQKGFWNSEITGLKTTVAYNKFMKEQQKAIMEMFQGMEKTSQGSGRAGGPGGGGSDTKRDSLIKEAITSVVTKFVKENSDSYVAAYVISENRSMLQERVRPIYDLMSPEMKKSEAGKDLLSFSKSYDNKILDGNQIRNFALPDDKGKEFNFSQLKGKYVWVDFWASWCQPCKMAFPYMREVYKKYKDKNVEILAISIDKDKQAWLKAAKASGNPWIQLWDNTSIASQFSVTGVPNSFLVGPDGKIIMSELGFDPKEKSKIELKLEELIGNK